MAVWQPTPQPGPAGPPTLQTPTWWKGTTAVAPKQMIPGSTLREYMQQILYNAAIPYFIEPGTQAETARWLSRAYPWESPGGPGGGYPAEYASAEIPPGGGAVEAGQLVHPGNLKNFIKQLNYDALVKQLPKQMQEKFGASDEETKQARADVLSGINWLREYLETSLGGLEKGTSRAQKQYIASHLGTLGKEAQKEPTVGGLYTTLGENLLNPIAKRPSLSGLFGTARAISQPYGTYRRGGVAFRNPTAV